MLREALNTVKREQFGSRASRRYVREGKVPVTLYAAGKEPENLLLDLKDFIAAMREGMNTLLELKGVAEGKLALVKAVQRAPVSDFPIHADLLELSMDKKVRLQVPVRFKGRSKGQQMGGMMNPQLRHITIESLPDNIPDAIVVDISELELAETLKLGDVQAPEGVKLYGNRHTPVVTIQATRASQTASTEAEAGK